MNTNKGFTTILGIIILLVIGVGVYLYVNKYDDISVNENGSYFEEASVIDEVFQKDNSNNTLAKIKTEEDIEIDDGNWQKQYYEILGFSIEYPKSLIEVKSDSVKKGMKLWFTYKNGPIEGGGITMSIEMRDISADDFIQEYKYLDEFNRIISRNEITFNGSPATEIEVNDATDLPTTYLLIYENDTTYIAHYFKGNDENLYHERMLSTLSFLN